jgi:hypothetical protein
VNKKVLKNKALQEMDKSMDDIKERKYMILETIIGLGTKVSKDVSGMRLQAALQSKSEKA